MPAKQPGRMSVSMEVGQVQVEDVYDISDSAMQEMHRRGIKLPSKPQFRGSNAFVDSDGYPLMPMNLMELTNDELGELYNVFQTYTTYVSGQLADVKNQYEVSKKKLGFISAHVRLAKEGPQKDRDVLRLIDHRFVQHDAEATRLKCLLTLLEEVRTGLEGNIKMVSRIVTLREQDLTSGQRAQAIQSRKHRIHYGEHDRVDLRLPRDRELESSRPQEAAPQRAVRRPLSRR